ncbi:peptide chain release factor N(5)-glutamine methyltransferase [Formicincola oecophyllae]|uniref:peptide chain release factor N(5)-glutamine methyltransferase n=1 Tax=Formicincola oecophyllae TaxID=2558361 RepID=UPI001F10D79D|nr:peptide chain release factor N(5)-glutamine methyltransferase [Formicincola oecophyllae]
MLGHATVRLKVSGIESPSQEARLILAWAAGCGPMGLLRLEGLEGPPLAHFISALGQRCSHVPWAYVTGQRDFWSLTLNVNRDTLIPRPDSETLIEALLAQVEECFGGAGGVRTILDLGTGSGCLLLAALRECPQAWGVGVDISARAARQAQANAARNGLAGRAAFMVGSWAEALGRGQGGFDVVLSNPPYIRQDEMPHLMAEVRDHEPWRALVAGQDGLQAYQELCTALPELMAPHGCAILELGQGQRDAVSALAAQQGLGVVACLRDLGGVERALVLRHAHADQPQTT